MQLPSLFKQFRYSQLGQDTVTVNGDATSPNHLYMRPVWASKRLRIVVPVTFLLCLVAVTLFFHDRLALPSYPLSSLESANSGSGHRHLVSTNAEILEAVAPSVDWSRFAYVQYVTNTQYLCNSVMLFAILERLGCRSERLMMYPEGWKPDTSEGEKENDESRLLRTARDKYKVKLQPIHVQARASADSTWAESYTKLLAMNQTHYDRVLSLDSDSTVLQCLDELFLLPHAPVAMPRAYWQWTDKYELSSQLLLVETNATEFDRVMRAVDSAAKNDYDMDILNHMYSASAMVLPHREYDLLTGEFKGGPEKDHKLFLGNPEEKWDPKKALAEAKFLHFSDWPIPKPWLSAPQNMLDTQAPKCHGADCTSRDIWFGFYDDFKKRRKEVCNFDV